MRKKILFVITKSNFGGAQRYVYDLATNLPSDHYEAVVAFGYGEKGRAGLLSRMLVESGIRTIVISDLVRDMHPPSDWRAFKDLIAMFTQEQPDVVHLNSSKAAGLGALAARIARVPRIVFTIHGLPADEDRTPWQRYSISFLTWLTGFLSHTVVVITSEALERVRSMPLLYSKVTLIHNGIRTPEFLTPHDALRELHAIDPTIPRDQLRIGMIGELHPNKDILTALSALSHVQSAHLVLIGDGEMRESLQKKADDLGIRNRVHFLGFVPDASRYIRAFDIFLMTSRKEGLPYVLLEAGSAGVPIVAVDLPSLRDIILNDFTGLLTSRDPEQLRTAITRLTNDHALTKSLANEMATRITQSFSLQNMLKKTLALY